MFSASLSVEYNQRPKPILVMQLMMQLTAVCTLQFLVCIIFLFISEHWCWIKSMSHVNLFGNHIYNVCVNYSPVIRYNILKTMIWNMYVNQILNMSVMYEIAAEKYVLEWTSKTLITYIYICKYILNSLGV